MRSKSNRRYNAEIVQTALSHKHTDEYQKITDYMPSHPQRKEQIRVVRISHSRDFPGRKHQVKRSDSIDGKADLARLPRVTTTQRITAHT